MAGNSVTIALKIDASQFNAGLAQAQSKLSGLSWTGGKGRGGGGSGGSRGSSASPLDNFFRMQAKNAETSLKLQINTAKIATKSFDKQYAFAQKMMDMNVKASMGADKKVLASHAETGGINNIDFGIDEMKGASKKSTKSLNGFAKQTDNAERAVVYFTSMMKGNFSSFNVMGLGKALAGIGGGRVNEGQSAKAALSGIGGIGEEGAAAASESTAAAGGEGIIAAIGSLGAMVGPVLLVIAAAAAQLVVVMAAVQMALKPILTILNAIGKVLGAALMPISIIIVTLLRPLIWLLMPIARLLMTILMPLRRAIQNYMGSAAAKNAIKSGNYNDFFMGMTTAIGQGLLAMNLETITAVIGAIVDAITSMMKSMVSTILNTVATLLDGIAAIVGVISPDAAAKITGLANGLRELVKSVNGYTDANGEYVSGDLDKLGQGVKDFFKGIKSTILNFLGLKDLESTGVAGAPYSSKQIGANVAAQQTGVPAPEETSPLQKLTKDLGDAKTAIEAISFNAMVTDAKDKLFGDTGSVKAAALAAWTGMLTNADEKFPLIAAAFKSFLRGLFDITNKVIDAINILRKYVPGFALMTGTVDKPLEHLAVDDFVLQPGGQLIKTSPQDYIMGTKDPGSIGGKGNVTNITFNVSGNVDDRTAKYITDTIQREIATQWRAIAR